MPEALYAPLPEPDFCGSTAVPEDTPLFTADQLRAYADATCSLRGGQQGWRPIETAPKDGSEFVARGFNYNDPTKGRHHEIAHWDGTAFVATPDGMLIVLDYLTDWAPLPADIPPPPSTHPQETQP